VVKLFNLYLLKDGREWVRVRERENPNSNPNPTFNGTTEETMIAYLSVYLYIFCVTYYIDYVVLYLTKLDDRFFVIVSYMSRGKNRGNYIDLDSAFFFLEADFS
jgi:hypothetical protein